MNFFVHVVSLHICALQANPKSGNGTQGFKGFILTLPPLEGTKSDNVGRELNYHQGQLPPPHFADGPGLTAN